MKQVTTPILLALLLVSLGTGCNGTRSATSTPPPTTPPPTTPPPAAVSVSISPAYTGLKPGASLSYSATVSNAKDTSVTWSIEEGSAGGTITSAGAYTAPNADGHYHVIATSNEDKTKSATAVVTVLESSFTATGNPLTGRGGHTATLLANGQVFIAGGADIDDQIVSSAEFYDPAKGTFLAAGTSARFGHTATRLANGDVLIAGGETAPQSPTASAQILKADTGLIQDTGRMTIPRMNHAATLLEDGRVLVTGGFTVAQDSGQLELTNTAEIYDPASGTFSPAPSMNYPTENQIAILLSSGKVLITGGYAEHAELYDPADNSFIATATQPAARSDVTATMLADGRVLLTGGDLAYEGMYAGPSEIFDPATEQFTTTGALNTPRWGHTATLLPDGTVLIAGGDLYNSWDGMAMTETTKIYDPATGVFWPGPPMLYPRWEHTATLLPDGSVLIVGAAQDPGDSTAELYK